MSNINTKEVVNQQREEFIAQIPHDLLTLPSKGLFYPGKKDKIRVAYLTAYDENILTSPNLLESGEMIDILLEEKILDKYINPKDMIIGDKMAILFFLRSTGYGVEYEMFLRDPKTGQEFEHVVDLSEVKYKDFNPELDENGLMAFELPVSKNKIKFRFLTSRIDDKLVDENNKRMAKMGTRAISTLTTDRLAAKIVSIDEVTDRNEIEKFVRYMNPRDAKSLRDHIDKMEPGLDLEMEVRAPSGEFFRTELEITSRFLWPFI